MLRCYEIIFQIANTTKKKTRILSIGGNFRNAKRSQKVNTVKKSITCPMTIKKKERGISFTNTPLA